MPFSKFLIIIAFCIIFPNKAFAYLDPGTGSIILQALISILAAIASFLVLVRDNAINIYKKIKKKKIEIFSKIYKK